MNRCKRWLQLDSDSYENFCLTCCLFVRVMRLRVRCKEKLFLTFAGIWARHCYFRHSWFFVSYELGNYLSMSESLNSCVGRM
mgnify:CR=1 FL=1